MTYQEAAKAALDVQDACNLSGVVFTFAEAMHAVCEEQYRLGEGTEWKNRNPIVTLFISKLADLNGWPWSSVTGTNENMFYNALDAVKKITVEVSHAS